MLALIKTQSVVALPQLIKLEKLLRAEPALIEELKLVDALDNLAVGIRGIQSLQQAIRRIEAQEVPNAD